MIIKNIFIPEKIGNYYVFGQRIAAFELTKTNLYVTVVYRKARSITIEKFIDIPLNGAADYADRAVQALKTAATQIPRSADIYTCLPSAQALLKELKLPFIGREKIAMVVNYEVESFLPFALPDAIIDFIVTREHAAEKSSEILVVAVQKTFVAQHLALFESAGLKPEQITLDVFGIYSIFKETPSYANKKGGIVLLEIENQQTRMAYIFDGALRSTRTFNKGLYDLARVISERIHIEPPAIIDYLNRAGLYSEDHSDHQKTYQEEFANFINSISLTLQSFTALVQPPQTINHIILYGPCTTIKGLPDLITDSLSIPCTIWDVAEFIKTNSILIKNKHATIPQSHLVTTGIALPAASIEPLNVRRDEFAVATRSEFFISLIIAGLLTLFIVLALAMSLYFKTRQLRNYARELEQESIEALRERFKKIPEDATTLDEVVDAAQQEIDREEKVWFAFSGAGRDSILRYLLELTTRVDKESLGLKIERLTIGEDTITLKASVRGTEELAALERDLRASKLFSYVEPQQDPKSFTMVIRLTKQALG